MPKTKVEKQKILDSLKEKIKNHKSMVFIDFTGIKVKDLFDLRKTLKSAGDELKIAKKTLMNLAFKENGLEYDFKKIKNELGLVLGLKDELAPIKTIYQAAKGNKNLKIIGGFFEKKFVGPEAVGELAMIPSRQELLGKMVGSIKAPVSNLVYVLQGNIQGLLRVLSNIKTNN